MVAIASAIRVMLEATVSIATEIRALAMDVLRMMELASVIRVTRVLIAPSKMKCHAIEVRMGLIIRYAAETALPLVHAIQMEII